MNNNDVTVDSNTNSMTDSTLSLPSNKNMVLLATSVQYDSNVLLTADNADKTIILGGGEKGGGGGVTPYHLLCKV